MPTPMANVEAWAFLRDNGLDLVHNEVHEGANEAWVMDKHPGYVARPCARCGALFIVTQSSDATTCGGHQE